MHVGRVFYEGPGYFKILDLMARSSPSESILHSAHGDLEVEFELCYTEEYVIMQSDNNGY